MQGLGNKVTKKQMLLVGASAIVGAAFGGWPGLQLGSALGSYLFLPREAKGHTINDELTKNIERQMKVSTVPHIIGTDMVGGTVIKRNDLGIYPPSKIGETFAELAAQMQIEEVMYANMVIAFGGSYVNNTLYINRVYFNGRDMWELLAIHDLVKQYRPGNYFSDDFDDGAVWIDIVRRVYYTYSFQNWKKTYFMEYEGLFGDPLSPGLITELNQTVGNGVVLLIPYTLSFPDIKAEVSSSFSPFTTLAFDNNYDWRDFKHGFKDGLGDYIYGSVDNGYGSNIRPSKLNIYTNTHEEYGTSDANSYDTITKGGTEISRQDGDKLYFFRHRNWYDGTHHHADYSFEYDIFYIDRSTDQLTSVIYNQQETVEGEEAGTRPEILFKSMEITNTELIVFGYEAESFIIITDYKDIEDNAGNTQSKIYIDLSNYPVGYWNDYYACINENECRRELRKIINQTATYIEVDYPFGRTVTPGEQIKLNKMFDYEAIYGIVLYGSTRSKLIVNWPSQKPIFSDSWTNVFLDDTNSVGINAHTSITVTLKNNLTRDPVPGEYVWFTCNVPVTSLSLNYLKGTIANPAFDYSVFASHFTMFNLTPPSINYSYYLNVSLYNEYNFGRMVILRFNKSTGAFIERTYAENFRPGQLMGNFYYFEGEGFSEIHSCATDDYIAVSFTVTQADAFDVWYLCLAKSDLSIVWESHRRNYSTYVCCGGIAYRGAVKAKVYVEQEDGSWEYEDHWITICSVWDNYDPDLNPYITNTNGDFLLDLGEEGLFLEDPDNDDYKLIKRPYKGVNPIPSAGTFFWDGNRSTFSDGHNINITNYDKQIFFTICRGRTLTDYGLEEVCRYIPPNESNKLGEFSVIHQHDPYIDGLYWINERWTELADTSFSRGLYLTATKYSLSIGGIYHYSNYCDENPIEALNRLLTQNIEFENLPAITFDYSDAVDICDELINDTVYYQDQVIEIFEPRYLYSRVFDEKWKVVDIITDILQTCMGLLLPCQNTLKVIIPKESETPVFYFGYDSDSLISNQLSDNNLKIYADFSAYPDNYWKGDIVSFIYDEEDYETVILNQTSTYLEVLATNGSYLIDASFYFPDSTYFTIIKDNIKEGSFTYQKKSAYNKPNRVRIEFLNRLMKYQQCVVDVDDYYSTFISDEIRIQELKMHGIKRATQAGRVALQYLDYNSFINWQSGFVTDIVGMVLCVGDIIGVTHPLTSWFAKLFRIVSMEEMDNDEVQFELEEYNSYVYHDYGVPYYQGSTGGSGGSGVTSTNQIGNATRFEVIEDSEYQRLYFPVKFPESGVGSFSGGIIIYNQVGSVWEPIVTITAPTISAVLAQDIDEDDTTIYYNLVLGTFPSSGYIYIDNELMYYNGIDTTNGAFTNVIRGINEFFPADSHTSGAYIYSQSSLIDYYTYPDSWVGTTQTFKAVSLSSFGIPSNLNDSPTFNITIIGYGALPYPPALIRVEES